MFRRLLQKQLSNQRLVAPAEFVLNMAAVYAAWRIIKYLAENYDNFLWGGWQWLQNTIGNALTACTAVILRAAGYQLTYYKRMINVDGTAGIYMGDLCLGIAPMVIFTGFILSFGNHTKNKLWFIPFGLLLIFIANTLRTVALVLVQVHQNHLFKIAHEYVYLLLAYGCIFVLVMWWMNKLAFKPTAPKP